MKLARLSSVIPNYITVLALCVGCTGGIGGSGREGKGGSRDGKDPTNTGGGDAGDGAGGKGNKGSKGGAGTNDFGDTQFRGHALRRLSAREIEATLDGLFPELKGKRLAFAPDSFGTFDTDLQHLDSGLAFEENAAVVAQDIVKRARADKGLWGRIRTCNKDDKTACVARFYEEWAPRILRRPADESEAKRFAALGQLDLGDTDDTVAVALEAMLRHSAFLHRVEIGEGAEKIRPLAAYELLSRLSFFLWGQGPDEDLRKAASGLDLQDDNVRAEFALEMLQDPRALAQVVQEHAQWLGYAGMPRNDLGQAMWQESAALIKKVVFDDEAPYTDLFVAEESYVTPALAQHYGLSAKASEGWASLAGTQRRGILGHGTFLSSFSNVADTSPVKRGKGIQNRLLCRTFALPVDVDVDVDAAPEEGECRIDFFQKTHAVGACAGCHKALDGVGFGLERFDRTGAPRAHEKDRPDCPLNGKGELDGTPFEGPAGLAEQIVTHEDFQACVVSNVVSFYLGQDPADSDEISNWAAQVGQQSGGKDMALKELLLSMVAAPEFATIAPHDASEATR